MPVSCAPCDGGGMVLLVVVSIRSHCCGCSTEQIRCSSLSRVASWVPDFSHHKECCSGRSGCVLCCECVSISGWSTPQEFWAGHLLDHPPTWLHQFMFPPVAGGFHGVTSSSAPGIFCLFILVTLVGVWQCHTVVLISLPLMTSGVECIFLCLSPFWISFFYYLPL